jgi:[acyl-carrier-protein] S-malonyltransferase
LTGRVAGPGAPAGQGSTSGLRKRIVLVCPGRGTYTKSELGFFARPAPPGVAEEIAALVRYTDEVRAARGDVPISELDEARQFGAKHVAGENAGALIYTATAADALRIDHETYEVVGVLGNSMGWYTALHVGGCLAFDEGLRLADTMAGFQRGGPIGGQVIWPVVDDEWQPDYDASGRSFTAVVAIRQAGLQAGLSIRLGGFEVWWGEHAAVKELLARIPKRKFGEREYPFQLQGHAAFHSPLLRETSAKAQAMLGDLAVEAPRFPLIDGRGKIWGATFSDPKEVLAYTLGWQVTETFDFTAAVRVALREIGPDHVVLLGPGDTLGGAIGQIMVAEGWRGIRSKADFVERQKSGEPPLIALARPEQAARVTRAGASG